MKLTKSIHQFSKNMNIKKVVSGLDPISRNKVKQVGKEVVNIQTYKTGSSVSALSKSLPQNTKRQEEEEDDEEAELRRLAQAKLIAKISRKVRNVVRDVKLEKSLTQPNHDWGSYALEFEDDYTLKGGIKIYDL